MSTPPLFADPGRAWAPYEPERGTWDLSSVAHLHRRAGFAAPWAVLERDRLDGLEASVRRLLDGEPPSHILVGHGEEVHIDASGALRSAIVHARRSTPAWLWAALRAHGPLRRR